MFTGAYIAHHLDHSAPSTPMADAAQTSSQRLRLQEEVFDCSGYVNKLQTGGSLAVELVIVIRPTSPLETLVPCLVSEILSPTAHGFRVRKQETEKDKSFFVWHTKI